MHIAHYLLVRREKVSEYRGDGHQLIYSDMSTRIMAQVLCHEQTRYLVDRLFESIASLEVLEFLRTSSKIYAVDSTLVESFRLRRGDHTLQLSLGLRTLEASIARIPELAFAGRFPFWEGFTAEVAENDLLEETLGMVSEV